MAGVIDGDTIILEDHGHVRLIGVDTPELGDRSRSPQPGAEAARDHLAELLPPGADVRLHFDAERRDRHGRMLAHVFLREGGNVQARILAGGFGVPLTVPPNLGFLDCYRDMSARAMAARRGLWDLEAYQPVAAESLADSVRGYRIVRGAVSRRAESADSLWLQLDGRLALRIERTDLPYFRGFDLQRTAGLTLEARGMIYRRNGQLRMRIRHPADLLGLPADTGTAAAGPQSEEISR